LPICGGTCGYVRPVYSSSPKTVLDYAAQMVRKHVLQRPTGVQPCQVTGAACQVNPASGNVIVQYQLPSAGKFDPMSVLTYNSKSNQQGAFGTGWNTLLQPRVVELSENVAVIRKGTGTNWTYTNPDANGLYVPPPGARDELVKDPILATWTETQPNGLKFHYGS